MAWSSSGFLRLSLSLLMLLLVWITGVAGQSQDFNVDSFGAVGDGKTESSQGFLKAWEAACGWKGGATVVVPGGTYLVNEMIFSGHCEGPIGFNLMGQLLAPKYDPSNESKPPDLWLKFRYVENLSIYGGGKLYGEGSSIWPFKQKCVQEGCSIPFPYSLRLEFVNSGSISDITSIDSKDKHVSIFGCNDLHVSRVITNAPGDSPNTDGIHLSQSRNIQIENSTFSTGDDCIAIISGTTNVNVTGVFCGPGHGISIGSLGGGPNEDPITGIHIQNCTFTDSMNGLQIKTWAKNPNYPTLAADISFEDIVMNNAGNPIFLNQRYCPGQDCDPTAVSQVQIRDVKFINIWGNSSTKAAVNLQCSSNKPCENIGLEDINLSYRNPDTSLLEPAVSSCSNATGFSSGIQQPPSCI